MAPINVSQIASEQAMRGAALATRQVVLHRGQSLDMWVGCGYPKSGTVWLCQLMGTYLGIPNPRLYRMPIAMRSVIHAHWRYDPRLPSAIYITRDGRDVMLSFYKYYARALEYPGKPRRARLVRETFTRLYGPGYDIDDVRGNLPKFIEAQLSEPKWSSGLPWHEHVLDWLDRPRVGYLTYEGLLADPANTLVKAVEMVTGERHLELAELAARRWSFELVSGRKRGSEDGTSFLRKGISGDWRQYFSRDAAEIFDRYAGEILIQCGYENTRDWF